jgi:Xaa-Pro aminopeptidase
MNDRIGRLRARMAEAGCDAFFSLSPPSNAYLTGFFGSTSCVVVTQEAARFLCDFRYTEQARVQVSGCEVVEVTGSLETRAGEHLDALGASRVAFEPSTLTVQQFGQVADACRGTLLPQPGVLVGLRMVKDPTEVARIASASALAESVLREVLAMLRPGVREREVAAQIVYEFLRRGAEGPSFDPIVLFGERSSLPHGRPGARALAAGDVVLIDMGCLREGYCSDLTRTFVYGTMPGPWFEEIYALTLRAQRAAVEAIRPGLACRDADGVAREIIREAGYGDHFGHGLGHGVGLEIHEAPRLNMQSDAVLEPGMVVTVEPGIYLPGQGGVRIEDLLVVTEAGSEVLTRLPKELEIL